MKEVLDAVIEFKGEYFDGECGREAHQDEIVFALRCTESYSCGDIKIGSGNSVGNSYWEVIGSREEFNALVDELASNFGECDISYQKHCSNEVIRLEGDKMKTVLDAVIKFKGECSIVANRRITHCVDSENWFVGLPISLLSNGEFVCTTDEFNALVDELASNFGECDISYQEYKKQYEFNEEAVRAMEELSAKTVADKGDIYQIGAVYEFSDNRERWYKCGLVGFGCGLYPWKAEVDSYKYIRECQAPIGTITEAPAELVDGECYQFEYLDKPFNDMYKGFYSAKERRFIFNGGFIAADSCVNIKPLTVEK